MSSLAKIHEKLIDRLIYHRKKDPDIYFNPRQRNTKGRLTDGYWFLGNDDYVFLSLWNGRDWKERVNCIGFVVLPNEGSWIELTAQGCPEVVPFLERLTKIESGFVKDKSKNKWFKKFSSKDYIKELDYFITVFKPKVDKLIAKENPPLISEITAIEFAKYGQKAIDWRNKQIEFSKINKITRLSWNTNAWRNPSGWLGKSRNESTHEGKHGFGFEEWLFDYSKGINGYQYGFIRGFETKNQKHANKIYNVHLYSQNNLGQYFYVGHIKQLEGISKQESEVIYKEYRFRNWLPEMEKTLVEVEADVAKFRSVDPQLFCNVRFKPANVVEMPEMEELSDMDENVTTDRFKLLDFKGIMKVEVVQAVDDEDEGNFKNTNPRKRTFNSEQVYDPYHDKMQNAIVEHLRSDPKYGYKHVYIEKSRVDVKAVNNLGEWDYFEIKTESPKRCVREALGQVMEYAYYPSIERAKNIIIVGDTLPDPSTIQYLDYLRDRFSLPVSYRFFDFPNNVLSEDY